MYMYVTQCLVRLSFAFVLVVSALLATGVCLVREAVDEAVVEVAVRSERVVQANPNQTCCHDHHTSRHQEYYPPPFHFNV